MLRRALALPLLALPLLLCATGCWPGIPLAAIAAAAGGGGGGGGGNKNLIRISGHIVTDGSAFATAFRSDHEPNDRMGEADEIGAVAANAPVRITGTTAVGAAIHVLFDDGSGARILARELLDDGTRTFSADTAAQRTPAAIARLDRELFLLDVGARGEATRIRVTPLESGFVKRVLAAPAGVTPAGFTALLDSLFVLDAGAGTTRLVALDATDAAPLFATDLGVAGLAHLAGADDLVTGAPRLFTSSNGRILEIALPASGRDLRDRRVGAVTDAFAPLGVQGGIAALGFDGLLIHVLDGAGTLRSYRTDGTLVATRALTPAAAQVRSLVAHLDLGFDGYHVEVAAGASVAVELSLSSEDSAALFCFALRRDDLENEKGAPVFHFELSSGDGRATLDNSGGATPAEFDVGVGARAGAARYALTFGDGGSGRFQGDAPPARDDDAAALANAIEPDPLATLPLSRLVEIYRDPLMVDLVGGQIVLGRAAPSTALVPPAAAGFDLVRRRSSPGGFEIYDAKTGPAWRGPAARSLQGVVPALSHRREESRASFVLLARLAGAAGVAWREPVARAHALAGLTPNDPQFLTKQVNHFDLMNVRDAWNTTTGDVNNVLAIVDTGIRTDNSDLTPNYNGDGFDFVSDITAPGAGHGSEDNDGLDADPFDEGSFLSDVHHGSHCAGTMGAKGNNNLGIAGINWDCHLLPVRALGTDGSGTTTDIAEGILYAARLNNSSGTLPAVAASVINLSLGTTFNSKTLHNAIIAAVNQSCLVCCAAGNDGNSSGVLFPAAFAESIAVAACDLGKSIASYSNAGPEIDITAPGGNGNGADTVDKIWSTIGGDSIAPLAGTSMACSVASGVCGLIKTLDTPILQSEARELLEDTAQDIETPGFDDLSGFGLIDANAALAQITPVLHLSAAEVDLGKTGTETIVQAQNAGGGHLDVGTFTKTALKGGLTSWLSLTLASDGKTIEIEADRTGLGAIDFQIQVDVTTNGGNGSFLVDLTGSGSTTPTDVGTVTIQLFSADGLTKIAQTTATAANGYKYDLPPVPRGSYQLKAGTDVNNDGVLGQGGELFGAFGVHPKDAAPTKIEFDALSEYDVDFVIR